MIKLIHILKFSIVFIATVSIYSEARSLPITGIDATEESAHQLDTPSAIKIAGQCEAVSDKNLSGSYTQESQNNLNDLPQDTLQAITELLAVDDLASLAQVNKSFNKAAHKLWHKKCGDLQKLAANHVAVSAAVQQFKSLNHPLCFGEMEELLGPLEPTTEKQFIDNAKLYFNDDYFQCMHQLNLLPSDATEFVFQRTDLKILPSIIGQYKNLRMVDLSNNQLGSLPSSFKTLTSLEAVYLGGNRFRQSIPGHKANNGSIL